MPANISTGIQRYYLVAWACLCFLTIGALAQEAQPVSIQVNWKQPTRTLQSSSTLQVVVNPMLRRGSPIHDGAFDALTHVGADYVRFVPWLPYPKLAVAELEPPTPNKTSWDFHLIDPITEDFLSATQGHSVILNFSTIPAWMFRTAKPVTYPSNPDTVDWNYTKGTELRDPSMRELGNYYARLVSWYTRGGFTDELGQYHASNHHYKIAYWEVFNEVDFEHTMTPQQYTQRYDTVVAAIHKVNPDIKFVGLALADPSAHPEMFEYFLNPANHRPGTPLDMISYHFYATPTGTQTLDDWQYTFFDQADRFLATVRYVEAMRKRLSPTTQTTLDEIGTILPTDNTPQDSRDIIPDGYWKASGALYAYVFVETAKLGIDVVGESQLVGYPTQFPSVSMVNWKTGRANARLQVLNLVHHNLLPGDQLIATKVAGSSITAQAFLAKDGKRMLLINKRNRSITVKLPDDFAKGKLLAADSANQIPVAIEGNQVTLNPFAVCILIGK